MKQLLITIITALLCVPSVAQRVSVQWPLSNVEDLTNSTMTGGEQYTSLLTATYTKGANIDHVTAITGPNASAGFTAVPYDPAFAAFYVTTRTTAKTTGHSVTFSVAPSSGHKFKPMKIAFDACKVGTDGGNFDVYVQQTGKTATAVATTVVPLRNRVDANNPNGFSHHEFTLSDQIVDGRSFKLILYVYNINGVDNENPKAIAFRNVTIEGAVDEDIFTAGALLKSLTCKTAQGETLDLMSIASDLKHGETARYGSKLFGAPTDFVVEAKDGYAATVQYAEGKATVTITKDGEESLRFYVQFTVSNRQPKPEATPLKRGLMSLNLSQSGSSGNLVSWRYRKSDNAQVKFKLYRGTSAGVQNTKVNGGKFITDRTNYRDTGGSASHYYRLEVYDLNDNLIETEVSKKTWANQTMQIPTSAPTDTRGLGADYTPNDAAFCDMDGDGEYEIVLKWDPSNSKDAASDGVTSDTYFDCYKLDGTRLWRINQGPNIRSGAHTTPFVACDLDGDGYGEFMIKTAPGTVDGEGNYVVMGSDDPLQNCLSGRGKPDKGPEYITVFDGLTGAELSTIKYHTDYAAGLNYWGDSKQNRSERYLACAAYLDGEDKNPSAIFNRGYYAGAFVGAYDFDGVNLTERWVSRNTTSGKGLWGEGAHWMTAADLDGDGKHEILFGSAALDHDGSLLWRTGLGHGDALHVSDFITDRPGLEIFMPHEQKPYGCDLRDAKTGELIIHLTASGDTGRGLAAHFDSSQPSSQFIYSASGSMFNCADGSVNGTEWKIGSSGAGINCRLYWDGDLYDEFFDKSIIAHWNPSGKWFDRYKVNNGNYTWGTLCNYSKNNPCVLGDLLGDWREEIVTYDKDTKALIINATSYETKVIVPHLMDDIQYRENIISQNCGYNQPPHLSFDPAIVYAGNPIGEQTKANIAATGIIEIANDNQPANDAIYTLQGVRISQITKPGIYIIGGQKVMVK